MTIKEAHTYAKTCIDNLRKYEGNESFIKSMDTVLDYVGEIDDTPISGKNMAQHGWQHNESDWEHFHSHVWDKDFIINESTFHCSLELGSNTTGRDWFVHVDNDRFESVGSMDVATYGQIDEFLKLLTR